MQFGTYMGVYWIAKFCLLPLGMYANSSFLLFAFIGMTVAVPFLAYRYAKMFRDRVCGGTINFLQSWVFLVYMYMFAAILTAVAHYIYFRFIDNGFMINAIETSFQTNMSLITFPGKEEYVEQVTQNIDHARSLSAIKTTMQMLSVNIINCSLIALITAPFVMKKKIAS